MSIPDFWIMIGLRFCFKRYWVKKLHFSPQDTLLSEFKSIEYKLQYAQTDNYDVITRPDRKLV